LRDFFSRWSPLDEVAFGHMVQAFDAIDREDYNLALAQYRLAEDGFVAAGNAAGRYRAGLEESYALGRQVKPDECKEEAQRDLDDLSAKRLYPWMQIQAATQIANCAEMAGSTVDALHYAQRAEELADSAGYTGAALRASGIYAESLSRLGDRGIAWERGV